MCRRERYGRPSGSCADDEVNRDRGVRLTPKSGLGPIEESSVQTSPESHDRAYGTTTFLAGSWSNQPGCPPPARASALSEGLAQRGQRAVDQAAGHLLHSATSTKGWPQKASELPGDAQTGVMAASTKGWRRRASEHPLGRFQILADRVASTKGWAPEGQREDRTSARGLSGP